MNSLKPFLYVMIILGIIITVLQSYFIVKSWQSGQELDVTSYLDSIDTINIQGNKSFDKVKEKEQNLVVDKIK